MFPLGIKIEVSRVYQQTLARLHEDNLSQPINIHIFMMPDLLGTCNINWSRGAYNLQLMCLNKEAVHYIMC